MKNCYWVHVYFMKGENKKVQYFWKLSPNKKQAIKEAIISVCETEQIQETNIISTRASRHRTIKWMFDEQGNRID